MAVELRHNVFRPVIPDQASLKRIAEDWAKGMGDVLSCPQTNIDGLASKLGHTLLMKEESFRVK